MKRHAWKPKTAGRVSNRHASTNPRHEANWKIAAAARARIWTPRMALVTEACFEKVERSVYGVVSSQAGIISSAVTRSPFTVLYGSRAPGVHVRRGGSGGRMGRWMGVFLAAALVQADEDAMAKLKAPQALVKAKDAWAKKKGAHTKLDLTSSLLANEL